MGNWNSSESETQDVKYIQQNQAKNEADRMYYDLMQRANNSKTVKQIQIFDLPYEEMPSTDHLMSTNGPMEMEFIIGVMTDNKLSKTCGCRCGNQNKSVDHVCTKNHYGHNNPFEMNSMSPTPIANNFSSTSQRAYQPPMQGGARKRKVIDDDNDIDTDSDIDTEDLEDDLLTSDGEEFDGADIESDDIDNMFRRVFAGSENDNEDDDSDNRTDEIEEIMHRINNNKKQKTRSKTPTQTRKKTQTKRKTKSSNNKRQQDIDESTLRAIRRRVFVSSDEKPNGIFDSEDRAIMNLGRVHKQSKLESDLSIDNFANRKINTGSKYGRKYIINMGLSLSSNIQKTVNDINTTAVNSCPTSPTSSSIEITGSTFNLMAPGCPTDSGDFVVKQNTTVDQTCLLNNTQKQMADTAASLSAPAQAKLGIAIGLNADTYLSNLNETVINTCATAPGPDPNITLNGVVVSGCNAYVAQDTSYNQICQIDTTQQLLNTYAAKLDANSEGGSVVGDIFGSGITAVLIGLLVVVVVIIIAVVLVKVLSKKSSNDTTSATSSDASDSLDYLSDADNELGQVGGVWSFLTDLQTFRDKICKKPYILIVIVAIVLLVLFFLGRSTDVGSDNASREQAINDAIEREYNENIMAAHRGYLENNLVPNNVSESKIQPNTFIYPTIHSDTVTTNTIATNPNQLDRYYGSLLN